MRLTIMAATSAAKAINRARVTGKFSLVPVAKLNLFTYFMEFAKKQMDSGKEEYRDKYQLMVSKFNSLVNGCPDFICNIREADCSSGQYESNSIVRNPYNPTPPPVVTPEPEENLPPTIDDNTITVENGVTTTLTLAMFTTDARYSDPEGDLLDAIRIDKIYSNNLGLFYVDGISLSEGQIITREQLEAGVFTHVGATVESIQKDGFEFSVRDEGSQTWVN